MEEDRSQPLVGVVLTALSLTLVVGIRTFASSCGVHEDGTLGSCHWAEQAVFGVGVVLVVLSIVRIFERDEGERRGLCLAAALLGVLVACMPTLLIDACATHTMQCHAVMRPFCLCVGGAIALVGGADLAVRLARLFR